MRRRCAAAGAPTIPGTAVKPRRRTSDEITAAMSRPVPPVPDQGDLVEHWRDCGLLDDEAVDALGGEQP
ncbi:hypothetical protein OHA98_41825 [Streptomyces sp. NBC_00654]|uniref:hypothetical protein n=1 Tax=Streptomyces sp. NBC_00654 TaxID=2975799 RepID=UPI00225637C8|nr:hypothetical protein [Streptomyces sp. NBC_00654]MCX4969368.1 hypothetical protein [Streptomyces sp. NBC_00654]MCX4971147.1 hypothetical protein [Streptomyces sp. NBC_00654]